METVIPSVIKEKKIYLGDENAEYTTQSKPDLVLWSIRLDGIQCLVSAIILLIDRDGDCESTVLRKVGIQNAREAAVREKDLADAEKEKVLSELIERDPRLSPHTPDDKKCESILRRHGL